MFEPSPCNPSPLVWVLLEPAMSPGFLPMETRGHRERRGAGAQHRIPVCPPGWRLSHTTASRGVGTAISCESLFQKALQKTQLTIGLLMFTPCSSSFFCIIKHLWWSNHHHLPCRVGTRVSMSSCPLRGSCLAVTRSETVACSTKQEMTNCCNLCILF